MVEEHDLDSLIRRDVLTLLGATVTSAAAAGTAHGRPVSNSIGATQSSVAEVSVTVEQGNDTFELTALENGETIEQFYDYGNNESNTTTNLETSDTSQLFFWNGPNGLSLVVLHDKPDDGSGAACTFTFEGLPTDAGEWVIQDDSGDFTSITDTTVDWSWNQFKTDGGAFRGGLDQGFEITITPAFNDAANKEPLSPGRITDWEALSGDPADPERIALTLDEPVTIRSEGVGVQSLIDTKRGQIEQLRGLYQRPFDGSVDASRVDEQAEDILDEIETRLDESTEADRTQFERALNRMVAAETATVPPTEQAVEAGGVFDLISENFLSAVTTVATEALSRIGGGFAKKFASYVGDIARGVAGKILDGLKGGLPSGIVDDLSRLIDDVKTRKANFLRSIPQNDKRQVAKAAEENIGTAQGEISGAVIDRLSPDAAIKNLVTQITFPPYYDSADAVDPAYPALLLPTPDQIELPDIKVDGVDLPDEKLPGPLQGFFPDKLDGVEIDNLSVSLPEVPVLDDVNEVRTYVDYPTTVPTPGVDTVLDDNMRSLRTDLFPDESTVGTIPRQDPATRTEVTNVATGGVSRLAALIDTVIDTVVEEILQRLLSKLSELITLLIVLCVVLAALSAVTGIGTIAFGSIAGTLGTVATAITGVQVGLDAFQVSVGLGSLGYFAAVHNIGTTALLTTDLEGLTID